MPEDGSGSGISGDDKGLEKSIANDPSVRKFFLSIRLIETFNNVFRYGTWLGLGYLGYSSIDSVAGKTTSLEFFHVVTVELLSRSLPWWGLTIGFCIWALIERSLRKRKTVKMAKRIEDLETRIDSQRTSSGLLSTGETHPDDRR